jgi:hypothetical protein
MAQRSRPKRSITLDPEIMDQVEAEARAAQVSVSQVIESHLHAHYQGGVTLRLEHLESAINELKAAVLPVVAKVADLIRQFEQDGSPVSVDAASTPPTPPIATYEEMYGPITPAGAPTPPEQTVESAPRKGWSWRG